MTVRGHVKDGVVVLDEPGTIPDGVAVSVRPLKRRRRSASGRALAPTVYERYKGFIGMAEGLPSDLSVNHDHYLYGVRKRS